MFGNTNKELEEAFDEKPTVSNPVEAVVSGELIMPFTGHKATDLNEYLELICNCGLAVECFDAFLAEYARTKDLNKAWWFAQCEWDV